MSYFDDNYIGGADGSDDENKNSSSESDDSDTETNIDENEVDIEVDDDDVAQGKDTDNESEEDEKEDAGKKIGFKKKYGVGFASDDEGEDQDEDIAPKENEVADDSENETDVAPKKKTKKLPTKQKGPSVAAMLADEEDDDDDPTGEVYLQKFDKEINDNYLVNFHPESAVHNYDEILVMTKVTRDKNGIIIDPLHKTIPYLTKYEKARVLGQRAKQINSGASVFVKVPEKVIDGYLIAELELQEKRIPFIIRRPLPNGGSEYWSIKDLENISF